MMARARRTYCTEPELQELERLAQGRQVLELGTWLGDSAIRMAQTARRVVTVDAYEPTAEWAGRDAPAIMLSRTAQLRSAGLVVPLIGRFEVVLPLLGENDWGLVFVDGFHDLESQRRQYELVDRLEGWVRVVAVHDWGAFETSQAAEGLWAPPTRVVDSLAVWSPARDRLRT